MPKIRIGCLLLVFASSAMAQTQPQPPHNPTPAERMKQIQHLQSSVNDLSRLRSAVGFLTVGYDDNGREGKYYGTCFFASYEDKRLGENRGFIYLVTNRHMAVPGINTEHPHKSLWVSVRLNLRTPVNGSDSAEFRVPISDSMHWYFPDDDAVDVAVLPIGPNESKFDVELIPTSLFATKQVVSENGISEGDSVWFTGYFTRVPGMTRIQPILRQGMLAMMPDEPIKTVLNKPGHLYLADMHTMKGNSGSPCFVHLGGLRNSSMISRSGFQYRLLGIISGYFTEDSEFNLQVAAAVEGDIQSNSGISMIVPADEIMAVLNSAAMQAMRDAAVAQMNVGH